MTIDELLTVLNNAKAAGAKGEMEITISLSGTERKPLEVFFGEPDVVFFPTEINQAVKCMIKI